ncbi:DUF4293 domain-containing protein [Dysgonomonas sp. 511]|uniref:DUF4293 domain-containing protein n=1 Tax=Dysgonomonas sp. 511 TaxID=2302930 RepID=UPI0013D7C0D0|nr:DUF4293 domain-containing protein [Dysgonomonas sp. 511]NDV79684.1 DUF4293 family protein [Dysgonomonas sp. 511]
MIQRIQTVYLLVAALLIGISTFIPLVGIESDMGKAGISGIIYAMGIGDIDHGAIQHPTWGVFVFAVISTILPLVNIFLYKKRKMQIKIGITTIISIILFYITFATYFIVYSSKYSFLFDNIQAGITFPIMSLAFNIMAIQKIKKDEKLVKSLDRIR